MAAAFGLLMALLVGLGVTMTSSATAADPTVAPVTDYANYPDNLGIVVPGCNGGNVFSSLDFAVGGVHHGQLGDFTLHAGDVITMTFTLNQACATQGISLAAKRAFQNTFDINDNQHLVLPFAYCGPGGVSCADAGNTLTLTIPPANVACNFQIDAVLGPPLQNVGPNGSYYGNALRGDNGTNMLISANNGGQSHCNLPPEPTTSLSCAEGGLVVDVVNPDNLDDITVDITADGEPVVTGQNVPAAGGTFHTVVALAEDTPTHVIVSAIVDGAPAVLFDDTVTLDCTNPAATVETRCADGEVPTGVVVTLTNEGATNTATFDVNGTPVDVAPDATQTIVLPATEGAPVHVTVSSGGVTLFDDDVVANCVDPHATISHTCASGGATVELSNPDGESPAEFTITVNGEQLGDVVEVPAGETQSVSVPVDEDGTVTIEVTEASAGDVLLASDTFTQDCVKPSATITQSCESGVTVAATNGGELPTTLTVTKNGTVIDTIQVPGGQTVSKSYPLAEDETGTFRVTGDGYDSGAVSVSHDCTQVEAVETTALPRTGSDIEPMTLIAGLLLALGGTFVAVSRGIVPALSKRNK